mmetsp:Transcript_3137/g.8494  ORF Transcript_3137/g.8494 Transcript_3137/m.8494 type:complete len:184 (+) Transcript_3137:3-554(+)
MADAQPGYQFPPFWHLPPFFTLQPHAAVRAKQLDLWKQLARDYCAHHRVWVLDVSNAGRVGLFRNPALQRQLTAEGLQALAEHLVAAGAAAWADGDRTRLLMYWRMPGEWADLILRWAESTGRIGSVETVLSLFDGDSTQGEQFHGAPRELVMVALQELERRGRAKVFRGATSGHEGVKFLPA